MSTRVTYDFSKPATLSQIIPLGASAGFDAETEVGRASALIGSSDDATVLQAGYLGDWANGIRYTVRAAALVKPGIEYDYGKGEVRVRPPTGADARRIVRALNRDPRDPRVQFVSRSTDDFATMMRVGKEPWRFRAKLGPGDGTDDVASGSALLAGGMEPARTDSNFFQFDTGNDTDPAGLFVFDAKEPLKLLQFMAYLSASASWVLTLRPLDNTDYYVPVASGTGQFLRVDLPAVILPGWGVGFEAAAQGNAFCTAVRY